MIPQWGYGCRSATVLEGACHPLCDEGAVPPLRWVTSQRDVGRSPATFDPGGPTAITSFDALM
jgi:hypothetical protein